MESLLVLELELLEEFEVELSAVDDVVEEESAATIMLNEYMFDLGVKLVSVILTDTG